MEDRLAAHPFFEGMKAQHLRTLADASMKSKFDVGEVIFREGDPANRFYLIEHGKVIVEAPRREKAAASLEIIGNGEAVGWSWLFPPFYSHFEARALEPTQSIFLFGTRIREECEKNHEFGYALLKRTVAVVIQRLQATRERLVELSTLQTSEPFGCSKSRPLTLLLASTCVSG
jgi:CRP-like cAMP-binding protein